MTLDRKDLQENGTYQFGQVVGTGTHNLACHLLWVTQGSLISLTWTFNIMSGEVVVVFSFTIIEFYTGKSISYVGCIPEVLCFIMVKLTQDIENNIAVIQQTLVMSSCFCLWLRSSSTDPNFS